MKIKEIKNLSRQLSRKTSAQTSILVEHYYLHRRRWFWVNWCMGKVKLYDDPTKRSRHHININGSKWYGECDLPDFSLCLPRGESGERLVLHGRTICLPTWHFQPLKQRSFIFLQWDHCVCSTRTKIHIKSFQPAHYGRGDHAAYLCPDFFLDVFLIICRTRDWNATLQKQSYILQVKSVHLCVKERKRGSSSLLHNLSFESVPSFSLL